MEQTSGQFLLKIRKKKQESQSKVAQRLNLKSYQWLCQIENGRRTVSPKNLDRLAEAYGCSSEEKEELVQLVNSEREGGKYVAELLSDEMELFRRFLELPKEKRQWLLRVANASEESIS